MDELHNPMPHRAASKNTVDHVLSRVSKVGNSVLSLLSGLLAAFLILYSGYVLYDTFYTQTTASSSWELLQYRPEILDDGPTPVAGNSALMAINEDYRAWLTLYDTNIDYPVVQGENDQYYASHDAYGEISLTGAIYLSASNTRGMTDSYNILYGHHMKNGAMFGALDKYKDESYFNSHREGVLITGSGVYDLYVFAVATTDAYEDEIYIVGDRAADVRDFLERSLSGGGSTRIMLYDSDAAADADRIVALSTCSSAGTFGRLVVFARMTRCDLITLDAVGYGDIYDAQPHGLQSVKTNYLEGTTLEYSTDGGLTWTAVPPTLTDVGTLVVKIRATNAIYGAFETTETIQVKPAPVTVTVLDAAKAAGADDPEFRAVVSGLLDDFSIVYTISRPGAGTDEKAGVYEGAIIAAGEQLQGNYSVAYVPGTMTITAAGELPGATEPPLAKIFSPFQPRGTAGQGRVWALVNLLCVFAAIYVFIPLLHLKAKYGRIRSMKKVNAEKMALRTAEELDEEQREELESIYAAALERMRRDGRAAVGADVTERDFGRAVEKLYYRVSRFARRFRIGFVLELVTAAASVIAFILTEDMRRPMVLIDRWTPLMLFLMLLCLALDILLMRYRDKAEAGERAETVTQS